MTDKEIIEHWDAIARGIETGEKSGAKVTVVKMTSELAEATYNLIKRLKRESNSYRNKAKGQKGELARLNKQVADLTEKLEALGDPLQDAQYKIAEQQAEIERLLKLAEEQNAEIKRLQEARNKLLYGLKQICKEQDENNIRAEAIKEFAERLKNAKQYSYERHENIVPVAVVDWIAQEMAGDAE